MRAVRFASLDQAAGAGWVRGSRSAPVHDLGADIEALRRQHDVTVLGRARTPSLLVRFGAEDRGMWEQLLAFAADLGPDRIRRAMLLEGR